MNGIYQHYKGKNYKILHVGYDTDTTQEVVIYQSLYINSEFGENAIWVRKKAEFC